MAPLSSYPNVFNTCLVLLRRDGFRLSYQPSPELWIAEKDGFVFKADNPIELLGLSAVFNSLRPRVDSEYWWKIDSPNILKELDGE